MGEPTYSYQLKPRKKDDEVWEGHFYLYLNRVHNGVGSSKYIGQVDSSDKRVSLILEKKDNDIMLKELALHDAVTLFH